MKHQEILRVDRSYKPAFILGDTESEAQWRYYVPNKSFYEFLSKVLDVLEGVSNKRAIWLQGSYGVGKSHACSVVAHLLYERLEDIEDYINIFSQERLKARLKNFRKQNRYIPIYLVGTNEIPSLEYMEAYLQTVIKEKLQELNIDISLPDTIIDNLRKHISVYAEEELGEVLIYQENKEAFIKAIERKDKRAIESAYKFLASKNVHIGWNFKEFIRQVEEKLQEKGFSGILIIWDEFTGIIDTSVNHLVKVQSLAENPYLNLILITHRVFDYYRDQHRDVIQKIADRFEHHRFELEVITTFHILKHIIHQEDNEEREKIIDKYYQNMHGALRFFQNIFVEKGYNLTTEDVKSLFPIHPYTLLLGVDISDTLLSAVRSLFGFLFGQEGILIRFLEKEIEDEPFITLDYLWDYLSSVFKDGAYMQNDTIYALLNIYSTYKDILEQKGEPFIKVFKAVLVFNLIYRTLALKVGRYHNPKEENIRYAFVGTPIESQLDQVLEFLDKERIIRKNPDGSYLITQGTLPEEEVKAKSDGLSDRYKKISLAIRDYYLEKLKDFARQLSNNVLRTIIPRVSLAESKIEDRPGEESADIEVFFGFPTIPADVETYKEKFLEYSRQYKNKVFVLVEKEFGEINLRDWIHWKAREEVARAHDLAREREFAKDNAEKLISNYLKFQDKNLVIFFRGQQKTISGSHLGDELKGIRNEIFYKGPELLRHAVENINLWETAGRGLLERLIDARNYNELLSALARGPERALQSVLAGVLTNDLSISVGEDHPIGALHKELERAFKEPVKIEDLKFITKPPYGLKDNKISVFVFMLALKPFQESLYKSNGTKPSKKELSEFILSVLGDRGRARIVLRRGSPQEEELTQLLKDIFSNGMVNFKEEDNYLIAVRNKIRDAIQKTRRPLWSLAHLEEEKLNKYGGDIKQVVRKLSDFIGSSRETISEDNIKEIYSIVSQNKIALSDLISVENLIEGFKSFIKRKLGTRNISIDEVRSRMESVLSNNSVFWKEEDVSERMDRIIHEIEEEQRRAKERKEQKVQAYTSYTVPNIPAVSQRVMEKTEQDLETYLKTLDRDTLLSLLKYLLETHPQIERDIRRWLSL